MHLARSFTVMMALGLAVFSPPAAAQDPKPQDPQPQDNQPQEEVLAADLKLLQGTWEMLHGNDGGGAATIRSVKQIEGNRETLRRYDARTGELTHDHSVELALSRSGDVRVLTFYPVGGDPKRGLSFVYQVDAENFYDIPGLLHGDNYRNYQRTPRVWHWKRVKETKPPPEISAALLADLESLGAKVTARSDGYVIDLRRKPGFSDRELDLVAQVPQVIDLTLERVGITDEGLEKLRSLPQINRLILNDCAISSAGLKILADLPLRESLISIGLRGTKIMGDDLNFLQGFPKLERVDVSQTAVTDASLPALQMLPLKVLTASETKFSPAALDELQKKNPKLVLKR
jgi:hypothetical protein